LPDNPISLVFEDGIPIFDVSGEVHMVVDLPNTQELVELSFDDELFENHEEDLKEDPEEDLELGGA